MNRYLLSGLICFALSLSVSSALGSQEASANPCPDLLDAILSHNEGLVADLLEDGADPNASLENCEFPIERPSVFSFSKTYYDLTRHSKPLHVAALFTNYYISIYDLLVEHGADTAATDHRDRTPGEVATSGPMTYVSGEFKVR